MSLTYGYDWLGNQIEYNDDASLFYERSVGLEGQVGNGFDDFDAGTSDPRPGALYVSANVRTSNSGYNASVLRGGWLDMDYGEAGNLVAMTVRGECHDEPAGGMDRQCYDDLDTSSYQAREDHLRANCSCDVGQHYQYRWDELNRLVEARRYDFNGTSGDWDLGARQRYRYDGANARTLKQTLGDWESSAPADRALDRHTLYVYPGDFERRGLLLDAINLEYDADNVTLGTETQYLVAGARITWQGGSASQSIEPDARIAMTFGNLIQSTSGVVDLVSGRLMELNTFYPNGAQETRWVNDADGLPGDTGVAFSLEPMGFTGKEADEEVGLVYFGMRYLVPRVGRWASPDPLQVHAGGGGQLNETPSG